MDQDELIMTDFFLNNFEEYDEFTEYMQKKFMTILVYFSFLQQH